MSSNLLIISKSFAVGGGGGGGAPVFAFLCLGFCGLYSFFVLFFLLLSRSGALAHRMTDFLVALLFDANVDEEVDATDVKDKAARMINCCCCCCCFSCVRGSLRPLFDRLQAEKEKKITLVPHKFMTWLLRERVFFDAS
jgi:hypothetical protein